MKKIVSFSTPGLHLISHNKFEHWAVIWEHETSMEEKTNYQILSTTWTLQFFIWAMFMQAFIWAIFEGKAGQCRSQLLQHLNFMYSSK